MGKFSDIAIDEEEIYGVGDDPFFDTPHPDITESLVLQVQAVASELADLITATEKKLFRVKYYSEEFSLEDLEAHLAELRYISKIVL